MLASPRAMLAGITESASETLGQTVRVIEEGAMLLKEIGQQFADAGKREAADECFKKAHGAETRACLMQKALLEQKQFSADHLVAPETPLKTP